MGDADLRSLLARAHAEIASGRPSAALQSVVEAVSAAGFHPDQFPSLLRAHQLSGFADPRMNQLAAAMGQVDLSHQTQRLPLQLAAAVAETDMMQVNRAGWVKSLAGS